MWRMPSIGFFFALLLGVVSSACSGTPAAFSTKYPDNDAADVEALLARVSNAPPRATAPIVVGITTAPARMYGFDLDAQRVLWQQPTLATSSPVLAGELAIYQTATAIEGVHLQSGKIAFSVARGKKELRGADGEGALAAFVMTEGMGTYAKSELVLLRRGRRDWTLPFQGSAGVPAVVGTLVLVPWSNQYVSAIDSQSAEEVARVRVRDGVFAHVFRDRGQTYVGSQHGMSRVTASIGSGTLRGSGFFKLPDQGLPGRPLLLRDVYAERSPVAADSAQNRIGLVWEPRALDGMRMGLENDVVYLVFYRFVFALDPRDFGVRWVYRSESDVVGAAAQPDGVLLVDEQGGAVGLGAVSGEPMWRASIGLPSVAARVPMGAQPLRAGEAPSVEERRSMLLAAAQDGDARMVPGRLLAVRALAKIDDGEATASLIALCDDLRGAPAVRQEACSAIKTRTLGADHLLAALQRHASYLASTTPPPVGPLAKAAASLEERRAVPALVAHLQDPATPSRDLPALVSALQTLQDPAAAPALSAFMLTYHADPIDEDVAKAVELAPAALAVLQGQEAKPALESVLADGLGTDAVRVAAREALGVLAAKAAADAAADQPVEPEPAAPAEEPAQRVEALPTHLSTELVTQALLPARDALEACLLTTKPASFQARVVIVVEEGKVLMVSTLPAELQSCVEPLVRAQTFPRTRFPKKERVTHVIKR